MDTFSILESLREERRRIDTAIEAIEGIEAPLGSYSVKRQAAAKNGKRPPSKKQANKKRKWTQAQRDAQSKRMKKKWKAGDFADKVAASKA